MHIVSDSGMDLNLPRAEMPEQDIHVVPHIVTLNHKSYRSGIDIQPDELYHQLLATEAFPTTSQPSPGDFADLFRRLATTDPEILCINMSGGLSGTANAARTAADLAPEARVTVIDSRTLSAVLGWQAAAAARAAKASWSMQQITELVHRIAAAADTIYTLNDLRYLIHGGRISHMKGLLASVLHIRPIIGISKTTGMYEQLSQARTVDAALRGIVDVVKRRHAPGSPLRAQIMHASNPEGASRLHDLVDEAFPCTWLPTGIISPVLGAHTGPSLVGLGFAAQADYPLVP